MNELQIRLSADISALTSALNKAKATIKSFESETEKESEKGNVGFKRKIGLIESLTNKAKQLRVALSQATNEQQVERYNQELEQTSKELTRLNSLGRQVTASLGSTSGGFTKVAQTSGSANGVVQEFGRTLQDAPYAVNNLGSVVNNVTRGLELFAYEAKAAGSTSKALANVAGSLVTPMNLTLLAVSALTAALTAYQMGAFDSLFATEDVGKAADEAAQKLDDYRNSLDAVTRASLEGSAQGQKEAQSFELLRAQAENANIPLKVRLEAVKELKDQYPDYLQGLTDEQILTGNVGLAYENLSKQIIATAKARAYSEQIAENSMKVMTLEQRTAERVNDILKAREDFTKAGASVYDVSEIEINQKINDLTTEQLADVAEINRLKAEEEKLIQAINGQVEQGAKFTKDLKKEAEGVKNTLANIFSEKDMITQFEMIGKAISEGVITPAQGQLIKDNLAKALVLADNESLDAAIRESLKGSFERATSRLEDVEIKEFPIKIDFKPEGGDQELGLIQQLQEQMKSITALRDVATDPTRIQMYNQQLKDLQAQLGVFTGANDTIRESNRLVADSFGALGTAIAANLDISNNAVKGFVSTVLSNAPKLIQAIIAQAKASNAAADIANAGNIKQATGNAIVTATSAAKGLGPIGLAALPILIGGALALVSSAFGKSGGGSGGGGGAVASAGAPPQIFTNKNTVTPPNQNSPNYNPGSDIDWDKAQGRLFVDIEFDKLRFGLDMASERKMSGG